MIIDNKPAIFHIDTGSSVNTLPKYLAKSFTTTNTTLRTWNNTNYKPYGEKRIII